MNTVGACVRETYMAICLASKIYEYVLCFKSSKLCSLDSEVSQQFAHIGKNAS